MRAGRDGAQYGESVLAVLAGDAHPGGGHDRRLPGIEAGGLQTLLPRFASFQVNRDELQPLWDAEAEIDEALALPGLVAGLVDLEHREARSDLRAGTGEGVEASQAARCRGARAV
jgi:hypothetical protein